MGVSAIKPEPKQARFYDRRSLRLLANDIAPTGCQQVGIVRDLEACQFRISLGAGGGRTTDFQIEAVFNERAVCDEWRNQDRVCRDRCESGFLRCSRKDA